MKHVALRRFKRFKSVARHLSFLHLAVHNHETFRTFLLAEAPALVAGKP